MPEIKTDIEESIIKDGRLEIRGYFITEDHTIADIARWIVKQDWKDEILYLLQEYDL